MLKGNIMQSLGIELIDFLKVLAILIAATGLLMNAMQQRKANTQKSRSYF